MVLGEKKGDARSWCFQENLMRSVDVRDMNDYQRAKHAPFLP